MDTAKSILIFLSVFLTLCYGQDFHTFVETNDPSNNDIRLTRMVLDPNNGRLYVGSVNRLYKLTSDLETEEIESTGPRDDNQNCIPPDFVQCDYTLVSTNNINKILVIDTDNSQLITCGNVYRGSCETRDMDTLNLIEWHDRQVATTATDGSTVAIITHGPNNENNGLGPNVLYVGRSGVPDEARWIPLSSRLLPSSNNEDPFTILKDEVGNAGLVQVMADFFEDNSDFNIDYISVFESNGFTYYVSVQPKTDTVTNGPFVTKIVQICQSCNKYKETYIDLPLTCTGSDGVDYNLAQSAFVTQAGDDLAEVMNLNDNKDIVVVSFAKADQTSKIPTDKSAICIYSIEKIREKYFEWLGICASDVNQPTGCAWSSTALEDLCGNTWLADVIGVDLCSCRDIGMMTCGTKNITATPCYTSSDSLITAVAAVSHSGHTVIFTGNQHGHLKKLRVVNDNSASEYEDIKVVHDNPEIVQNGLVFDVKNDNVYVMSKRQITKVPVENCEKYTTCDECLGVDGVGDPYCGWCTLENRCTRKSDCEGYPDSSTNRWIADDSQCPSIDVDPSSVEREKIKLLTLTVTSLPHSRNGYKCVFDSLGTTDADAADESNVLTCTTPPPSNIPPPGNRGYVRVKLSLLSKETNEKFVSTDFDFYDCESFKTCMTCTKNNYGCDWCVFENKCSKDVSSCIENGIIKGDAIEANSSQQCPQIKEGAETLIPVDLSQEFYVVGVNFPQPSDGQTGYDCILHIEGVEVTVTGERESTESIKCQSSKYMYSEDVSSKLVSLQLKWNNDFEIDNPDNVKVNLYKCDVGRPNCGVCHQAELKYQCGWCNSVNEQKCTVVNKCNPINSWLTREEICPNPTIDKIKPEAGPVEGGTRLTIMGYNLGKNSSNVKRIDVAGLECIPQSDGYRTAEQVQCLTSPSNNIKSGSVSITIGNDQVTYSGVSSGQFSYVVPQIDYISPMKGPQSGGTKVTVTGENLNAGSNITATIAGLQCYVTDTSYDTNVCVTSASENKDHSGTIRMYFDDVEISNDGLVFTFTEDPRISKISSTKAFVIGGTKIVVTGENLNIVQTTLMRVYKDVLYYDSPCKVESSTKMVCKAPDISATNIETTAEQPYKVDYGFILDSVENTTHLINSEFGAFSYYPNPEYYPFENEVKVYSGVGEDPLVIPGQHLNLASSETDVTVMIGSEICEVISLAWNQLTCQPPRQQPNGGSEEKGVELWIYHGNLNVTTGSIKYASAGPPLSIEAIIAIAAAGTVCLVVFIIILILYRRKSTESNRNVKKLQVQLDMLESRVAKECKEAFAELQTEVTEMTTDIEAAGIPFLDYRNYTMKVLFPGDEDHPVLKELEVKGARKADVEKGLREFGKLINNKTFLLIFIRTLEAQNNFKMKDRVNVASLIMVALQGRMEYATDILKALLAELINRSLEGKSHPKLLLRRTESVAEKMLTNWLTFMLYRFLKDCAGEPLFMLYRALKQQIEKGPVDACTHEARYSLSEAKLIRQQIDYKTYLINVVNPDTVFDSKEEQYIQVKVLDCDTISQVKEKFLDAIYKNAPYSSRPRVEQVDLEWRQGFGGRLSLADDDVTCKVEGEWKRINTLEHYKVLDSAIMALVPKQGFNMSPGVTSLKGGTNMYGNMSLTASPGHRSNSSMLINSEIAESGQKFWHLIKQHDVDLQKEGDRSSKMMSEIYLTRLLSTKGTLQKYVDDFLETLFSTVHHGHALPQAIKYLFDFLDEQALEHGITDPDVVHTWKSNSLPLRFWVNVIKNPDFVFDVYKSQTVDACLSVVAQTFMDSCSTSEHKLGKDSPSSKLLYARDIPHYRDWVYRYYEDIKNMPTVSDQDMSSALADESRVHQFEFNTVSALNELYFYFTHKYNDQILEALEDDDTARKSRLAYKLEQVGDIMSGQH